MGHQLSQMCDLWEKYFLFLGDMCDHEWSSFIYIYNETKCVMGPPWSQMCDLWKKYFLFLGDMCDHEWSSFIYIQWDQMCSGSPMITDVWLVKKIFFSDQYECVTSDHLLYIYTMRPNVWWVANYDICVRWQKKYFWFSMTHTNVWCVSFVCV